MPEFIHLNARDVSAKNMQVLAEQGYCFDGVTLSGSAVFRLEARYEVRPPTPPPSTGAETPAVENPPADSQQPPASG